MKWKTDDNGWNPYLTGALVGLLAIASVLVTTELLGKTTFIGASTSFVRAAGFLERTVSADHVAAVAPSPRQQSTRSSSTPSLSCRCRRYRVAGFRTRRQSPSSPSLLAGVPAPADRRRAESRDSICERARFDRPLPCPAQCERVPVRVLRQGPMTTQSD